MDKKTILSLIMVLLIVSCGFSADNDPNRPIKRGIVRKSAVLKALSLPEAKITGDYSLEEAIAYRRSVRQFRRQSLTLETISQLLWAGQGVTDEIDKLRAAPSAGALYPIELYVVIRGGIYSYDPNNQNLTKLITGDSRGELGQAAMKQAVVEQAPCSIILAGNMKKLAKYGKRARQFMFIEAGHIAQNILLQATVSGLGSVPIGSFDGSKVRKICRMKPGQEPLYIISLGYPLATLLPVNSESEKKISPAKAVSGQRAVIVLPDRRFNDREVFDTMDIVSMAGVQIDIAGMELDVYRGERRGTIETTVLIDSINVDDYDAFILVSARSVEKVRKKSALIDILYEAAAKGKVIAAIGKATRLISFRDIVSGYMVTGDSSARAGLRQAGATFTGATAERDDNIITAQDSDSVSQFAKFIIEALAGYESTDANDTETGRYVPGKVRKRREQLDEYDEDEPRILIRNGKVEIIPTGTKSYHK